MEGHSVELDAVGEEDHGTEDAVGETGALGGGSLGFVLEEVGEAFEAHNLSDFGKKQHTATKESDFVSTVGFS